jgi:hypothetical protein
MRNADITDLATISKPGQKFCGWPTLERTQRGDLLLVYNGGREAHACPFGQIHLMRSADNGRSWDGPAILADGPLDERDGGVLQTCRGTLLVNWFTSVAWLTFTRRYLEQNPPEDRITLYREWEARGSRLPPDTLAREFGHWIIRSEDGGNTWSKPIPSVANSPHGPIQLSDGRLLFAGKRAAVVEGLHDMRQPMPATSPQAPEIGAAESVDDGKSWRWIGTIPPMEGHDAASYHELHAIECTDGRILAQIRNHNPTHENEILQAESQDGGATWSRPHPTGIRGYPPHLRRLRDGRILLSYGHRSPPWGIQCRLSGDEGRHWGEAIVLLGEGDARDLGYPATVQTGDRELLTVWYERLNPYVRDVFFEQTNPSGYAVLRMARWTLPD